MASKTGTSMKWTYIRLLTAAWLLATMAGRAQGQNLLLQEVISREVSLSVGEYNSNAYREIVSREASVFVGAEPTPPYQDLVSRE